MGTAVAEFEGFVRSLGLRPRSAVTPDGRWHRCPTENHPRKRNGAWKLAPDARIGWVQDWAVHDSPVTWRTETENETPEFDRRAFRAAQAETRRAQYEAMQAARSHYEAAGRLSGPHPYLDAKGLTVEGCGALRVDEWGWLVVPAYRERLVSIQRIAADGTKRFWKGAPVSGSSFVIGRSSATVNVLCEGLATGLACYQALRNARVWVLWNTGNLKKPPDLPTGLTVIAADNDHGTEAVRGTNPGIEAAKEAAEQIGCGIAYPEWIHGTDWADWRLERIDEASERAGKWDTEASIRGQVDAALRTQLMRKAVFVTGES